MTIRYTYLTEKQVKFSELAIFQVFGQFGELCVKQTDTTALTPYCAKGMTAGFHPDEICNLVEVLT